MDAEFTFVKTMGRGAFAEAELHMLRRHVVLKKLDVSLKKSANLTHEQALQLVENEVALHSSLNHQNVVKVFNTTWRQDLIVIMELEYCDAGTLSEAIERQRQIMMKPFPSKQVRSWLAQLAFGLGYIHDSGIVHHDFKPENIFLMTNNHSQELTPKIGDFGLATFIGEATDDNQEQPVCCGTLTYMAPESYAFPNKTNDPMAKNNPKIDVWAFGVVAFEIATLELPFPCSNKGQTAAFELYNLQLSNNWSKEKIVNFALRQLVANRLLVFDPSQRADMIEVLSADNYIAEEAKRFHQQKPTATGRRGVNSLVKHLQQENARQRDQIRQLIKAGAVKPDEDAANISTKENHHPNNKQGEKSAIIRPTAEKEKQFFDAVKRGETSIVRGLLRRGHVRIDAKNGDDGLTALTIASQLGHLNLVRLLVQSFKANVITDDCCLIAASGEGHLEIVQMLVDDFGADLEGRNKQTGFNALMASVVNGREEVVDFLLESGARRIGHDDRARLELAITANNREIVEALLQKAITIES